MIEGDLASLAIKAPALGRGRGEDRVRLLEDWKRFEEDHQAYAAGVRAQALAEFIDVAADFVDTAASERRRDGRLSFQDLLLYARDLLKQQPRVRRITSGAATASCWSTSSRTRTRCRRRS